MTMNAMESVHIPQDVYHPVFSQEEEARIEAAFEALKQDYLASNHRKKVDIIERAFTLARIAHSDTRRKGGDPYILHPIEVAHIVCKDMGMGSTSICAALLHDVVEDTEYTLEDLRIRFGNSVAHIVNGLTKISSNDGIHRSDDEKRRATYSKLLLAMSDDVRTILIKLADRLHNMRTMEAMPEHKQLKISGETEYIYIPIAHRLGLFAIKTELEDLCFRYQYPNDYESIGRQIEETKAGRENLLNQFVAPLERELKKRGWGFEIKARVKSRYSIWRKMKAKDIEFKDVYDLFAIRIVVDGELGEEEVARCWSIYSMIGRYYRFRPDRLRDWINTPKNNGYQAIHCTVWSNVDSVWVEVQIRSRKMEDIAERGIAAHWIYKGHEVEEDKDLTEWLNTVRSIIESPTPEGMDVLDSVKQSAYIQEIRVFTPKGDEFRLPLGATVLDLAYHIHQSLGDHCIAAKINGDLKQLTEKLQNGDLVQILDSQNSWPKPEWLSHVITPRAKTQIEQALRRKKRESMNLGEKKLQELFAKHGEELTTSRIDKLVHVYKRKNRDELFLAIGEGAIDVEENIAVAMESSRQGEYSFFRRLIRNFSLKNSEDHKDASPEIDVVQQNFDRRATYILEEIDGVRNFRLCACCQPLPGDAVMGIADEKNRIMVHQRNCPIALKEKGQDPTVAITTHWSGENLGVFPVTAVIRGIDGSGLLHAITETLVTEFRIGIRQINLNSDQGLFEGELVLLVHSMDEFEEIRTSLKRNKSILVFHRKAPEDLQG